MDKFSNAAAKKDWYIFGRTENGWHSALKPLLSFNASQFFLNQELQDFEPLRTNQDILSSIEDLKRKALEMNLDSPISFTDAYNTWNAESFRRDNKRIVEENLKSFKTMQEDEEYGFYKEKSLFIGQRLYYHSLIKQDVQNRLKLFLDTLYPTIVGIINRANQHLDDFDANRRMLGELLVYKKSEELTTKLAKIPTEPKNWIRRTLHF